ncbi:MAG: DUF4870 domain-containing protein [Clostridia bacterium]|nr:DUF4870 domain-containing protein [Clostridia bacterium]
MNEKTKGVIAYLFGWVGGLIILLGYKDSQKETKVHAAQAIVLSVAYMIISFAIAFIPVVNKISWILSPLYFVLAIIGCVKAYNLQEYNLPIISEQAKKIFAKQIEE